MLFTEFPELVKSAVIWSLQNHFTSLLTAQKTLNTHDLILTTGSVMICLNCLHLKN